MLTLPTTLTDAVEQSRFAGITTGSVTAADYSAMGALHDRVFGPGALTRTAYRVREGLPHHTRFCRLACNASGEMIGFIRFAPIRVGTTVGALMLGPLAIDSAYAGQGHARRLIAEGLDAAASEGQRLVVLVGDVPYYGRLGFQQVPFGQITMPGPVDPARLLAFELVAGALRDTSGMITGDRNERVG